MDLTDIHMEPLHRRPDLIEACVDLLNCQWPRSKAARLYSLEKSCDGLPYSLVMVVEEGRGSHPSSTVIGYCRLAKVYSLPRGVLIECVVVPEHLRGLGLGRRVMELAESHARKQGYTAMYLSTKDKHDFYAHLGYEFTDRVNTLQAQLLETCDCLPAECNVISEPEISYPSNCACSTGEEEIAGVPLNNSKPTTETGSDCPIESNSDKSFQNSSRGATPIPLSDGRGIVPPPPPIVAKTQLTTVYWMKKDVT